MSLLDTLTILFETNADAVAEDMDKVDDALKHSEKDAAKVDAQMLKMEKSANKLSGGLVKMARNMGGLMVGFMAFAAVRSLTEATREHNVELDKQAKSLRMNVETMQEWHGAFEQAGSSGETFDAFFKKLSEQTTDPIAKLGQLTDQFERMNEQGRNDLGKQLGLDAGAIALMSQGRRGIDELLKKQRELGVVTSEDIEIAKKYNETQRQNTALMASVKNSIASALMPAFNWILEKVNKIVKYFKEHKPFILAFFAGVAAIVTAVFLPAIVSAAAATWAFLGPWLLIGAAIFAVAAVVALLVDDIYNFLNGNDSLIGELAKKWPIIGTAIEAVAATVGELMNVFGELWDAVKECVGAIIDLFGDLLGSGEGAGNGLSKAFAFLIAMLQAVLKLIGLVVKGWTGLFKLGAGAVGKVAEWLGVGQGKPAASKDKKGGESAGAVGLPEKDAAMSRGLSRNLRAGRAQIAQTHTPLAAQTSNSIQNQKTAITRQNTVQIQKIDVNTPESDAKGVASGIGDALKNQLSGALNQFDDGVAA
ncbi:MAG: hypothetical protein LBJ59_02675 [Zoogloeaceae bacterium]|jgi:hypothetical protein|nr:hypothetical protein [Zoogloeaceae bacterium]